MLVQLTRRERQALTAAIVLLPVVLAGAAVLLLQELVRPFVQIAQMFFLGWLLAFLLDPLTTWLVARLPRLARGVAAAVVLICVTLTAVALIVLAVASFADSFLAVLRTFGDVERAAEEMTTWLQERIDALGADVDVSKLVLDVVGAAGDWVTSALGSAVAGGLELFATGTAVVFIAVVMVANKRSFLRFVRRLVPEGEQELYDRFTAAVARSFGGFIRGQFGVAALFGLVTGVVAFIFGVPSAPLVAVLTAALQSIPYFGQLLSWMPLIFTTLLFTPSAIVPVTIVTVVALLVIQNVVTPRVLGSAVGLNPIVVLAAVFIGAAVAGPLGAIFGVPVLAVMASLFNAWLDEVRPAAVVSASDADATSGTAPDSTAGPGLASGVASGEPG